MLISQYWQQAFTYNVMYDVQTKTNGGKRSNGLVNTLVKEFNVLIGWLIYVT